MPIPQSSHVGTPGTPSPHTILLPSKSTSISGQEYLGASSMAARARDIPRKKTINFIAKIKTDKGSSVAMYYMSTYFICSKPITLLNLQCPNILFA